LRREVCPVEVPVNGLPRWIAVFCLAWLLALPFLTDVACFIFTGFFLGVAWVVLAGLWLCRGCCDRACLCSPAGLRWGAAGGAFARGLARGVPRLGRGAAGGVVPPGAGELRRRRRPGHGRQPPRGGTSRPVLRGRHGGGRWGRRALHQPGLPEPPRCSAP